MQCWKKADAFFAFFVFHVFCVCVCASVCVCVFVGVLWVQFGKSGFGNSRQSASPAQINGIVSTIFVNLFGLISSIEFNCIQYF